MGLERSSWKHCRYRNRTNSKSVVLLLLLLLAIASSRTVVATAATGAISKVSRRRRQSVCVGSMQRLASLTLLGRGIAMKPWTAALPVAFTSPLSFRKFRTKQRTTATPAIPTDRRRHSLRCGDSSLQILAMSTNVEDGSIKASNSSKSNSLLEEKEQNTESVPPVPPARPKKSSPFQKQRQMHRHTVHAINDAPLDWERFEFSESPKWDRRFDANTLLVSDIATTDATTGRTLSKEEGLERLFQQEVVQDVLYTSSLQQGQAAWASLDAQLVQDAIQIIQPCINADRVAKIHKVLSQRTRHARFLFENPANPSNVWACLRTIEAFGLQHVDVVVQSDRYRGKAALSQKRGLRTAMGSAQWLTLSQHASTASAIHAIRNQVPNVAFYAADLHPSAIDIRCMPWTMSTPSTPASHTTSSSRSSSSNSDDTIHDESTDAAFDPVLVDDTNEMYDRPICIVMGNEESGISNEMRLHMDLLFTLPMVGFAESFNLSVATAITLAHMSAASSSSDSSTDRSIKGPLRPGDLTHHERQCLLLKGLLNSLPQKRMAKALLKQAGIVLPPELSV